MDVLPARILMCRPDYYGIEYEINPWMDRTRPVDTDRAARQWRSLKDLLEEAGAEVVQLPAEKNLPDMVFTANAGLVFRDRVVMARFRHAERQGEEPFAQQWFESHGFTTEPAPEGVAFEGAGDALFLGETLIAGYRIRSDALGHQQIGKMLGVRVLPLEMVDPFFYHLDTCFCPLSSHAAIYYPGAFDRYGRQVLEDLVEDLIEVAESEARRFGCNAVVVGDTVITNTECPRLHHDLAGRGFRPRATALDEFTKAGGSAKCLTLRLDGEEAARWRFSHS